MNYNERFGQIEAMLADLLRRMDRQAEQIDSIISILKISNEQQTRAEERQDAMLAEIREQGQRIDAQGQRIDAQGRRTDALLTAQMQMLDLMSRQTSKTDELTQQIPSIAAYESRVRRLEEAVFNKAS